MYINAQYGYHSYNICSIIVYYLFIIIHIFCIHTTNTPFQQPSTCSQMQNFLQIHTQTLNVNTHTHTTVAVNTCLYTHQFCMGTCAMTIIHHGLCHPGITAELQHRPADVGHTARARGGKDDPHNLPPLLNKCCCLPVLLHTIKHTQADANHTCISTHKHLYAQVHTFTHKPIPAN